jgi:hypothetical protein
MREIPTVHVDALAMAIERTVLILATRLPYGSALNSNTTEAPPRPQRNQPNKLGWEWFGIW